VAPYVEYDEVEAICPECGRIFRAEEALRAHRLESHPAAADPEAGQRPHRVACSLCDRTFPNVAGLTEHNRRSHTG
jgi:hypothetical protein